MYLLESPSLWTSKAELDFGTATNVAGSWKTERLKCLSISFQQSHIDGLDLPRSSTKVRSYIVNWGRGERGEAGYSQKG